MGYYRVVGSGSQVSEPMEEIVVTATEADYCSMRFRRLCGRTGIVEVWKKNGRRISLQTLSLLAKKEKAATLGTLQTG